MFRFTMTDAIKKYAGFDITGKSEAELRKAAEEMGVEIDETMGKGKIIDEIFCEKCEANFVKPTFVTDYPKEMSLLCIVYRDKPELTELFKLCTCVNE